VPPSPLDAGTSNCGGGDVGQEDVTEADRIVTTLSKQGPAWVARRVLADFTEAQFYGTELASAGLIGGTLLAFLLNPSPALGAVERWLCTVESVTARRRHT